MIRPQYTIMKIENFLFAKSVCQNKRLLWTTMRFLGIKLIDRYRHRFSAYGRPYYPEDFKKRSYQIQVDANPVKWALPGKPFELPGKVAFPPSLKLAGSKMPLVRAEIDWGHSFADSEDEESLHRWNWLQHFHGQDPAVNEWVIVTLEDWVDRFLPEIHQIRGHSAGLPLRWQSYTIGERISNTILYFDSMKMTPPGKIVHAIHQFGKFLLSRLEYKGKHTGNHVVNNARAIYMAGVALNRDPWRQFARDILKRQMPELVTPDGFMREGSSHYQMLFTRWTQEILRYAGRCNDAETTQYLSPFSKKLLQGCHFYLINKSDNDSDTPYPLFGDISPDFSPRWVLGQMTDCLNATPVSHEGVESYPESGWHRLQAGSQTVILRASRTGVATTAGHFHNDFFHFHLSRRGTDILVDAGRRHYHAQDHFGNHGLTPFAHNSIVIDGVGEIPDHWHRFPIEYSQSRHHVQIQPNPSSTQVILETDGFKRLRSPVMVRRDLELSDDQLLITDKIRCQGRHHVQSFLHWGPKVDIAPIGHHRWQITAPCGRALLILMSPVPVTVELTQGGESPMGWMAVEYGRAVPAWTMTIRFSTETDTMIQYDLNWNVA